MSGNWKNRLCISLSLLLLFSVGLHSAEVKPSYGKAAQLLQEWKTKIEVLRSDLEAYKQQLTDSANDLRAMQQRLETLQTEVTESLRELNLSIESSENLARSLISLRKSLKEQARKHVTEKIEVGIIAAILGALIGALAVAFIK